MKYLLLIVVLGLLWLMFVKRKGAPESRDPDPRPPESMVVCAYCGVHTPRSEAQVVDGQAYCSPAHAKAARRR